MPQVSPTVRDRRGDRRPGRRERRQSWPASAPRSHGAEGVVRRGTPVRARGHAVGRGPREARPEGPREDSSRTSSTRRPARPTRSGRGCRRARIEFVPHTSLPSGRDQVRPKFLVQPIVAFELLGPHGAASVPYRGGTASARCCSRARRDSGRASRMRADDRPAVSAEQRGLERAPGSVSSPASQAARRKVVSAARKAAFAIIAAPPRTPDRRGST